MSSGKWRPFFLDLNVLMTHSRVSSHMLSYLTSPHYSDITMNVMAIQITSVSIVCWPVCSGADQRKHQSSASLAFVRGINGWPVVSSQRTSNAENVSIWWLHHVHRIVSIGSCNRLMVINSLRPGYAIQISELGQYWIRQWLVACSHTTGREYHRE